MSGRRYLGELGLDPGWSEDDKRACLSAAREAYRELKRRHGGQSVPIEEIPGFLESVEWLLQDGFSLTDVGVMIGVSRERVRQWASNHDLQRRSDSRTLYRIWDDDKNRFVPIPSHYLYPVAQHHHDRRIEREAEKQDEAERRRHVEAMKRLAKRYGRTPTLSELREELGKAWPALARYWGYDEESSAEDASYAAAYRNLCDAARVPPRETGGAGHVS